MVAQRHCSQKNPNPWNQQGTLQARVIQRLHCVPQKNEMTMAKAAKPSTAAAAAR
jgi:hypothetical protein